MPAKRARKAAENVASISAAASKLKEPLAFLQRVKKMGCDGFRGNGSVNIPEVRAWLEKNRNEINTEDTADEEGGASESLKLKLECRRLLGQCVRIEGDNAIRDGLFTANELITADHLTITAAARAELNALCSDAPAALAGLGAPAISAWMEKRKEKICANLNDALSKLYA